MLYNKITQETKTKTKNQCLSPILEILKNKKNSKIFPQVIPVFIAGFTTMTI